MLKQKYNQFLLYSAAGLFIYMPFHVFLSQWLSTYTGGLDVWKVFKDGFTALVTILFIVTVYARHKQTKLYQKLLIAIVLYGLIHIVIGFATSQPIETFLLAIVYNLRIFCYLLIGYSLALLWPKAGLLYKYRRLLLILSTIICLLALLQWLLPKDILTHFGYSVDRGVKPNFFIDDKPDLPRAFSTLRDPNSLGAFLLFPIVLLVQSLITNWRTVKRNLLLGLLLLHIWVLFMTFSRSSLLATTLAVAILLILSKKQFIIKHKTKLIVGVTILCIVTVGLVYVFRDQYFVQNTVFHADESTSLASPNELRRDLAKNATEEIIQQPLGHGPGTAGLVSIKSDQGVLTENYYLQILYEVGIIGCLVFIYIFYHIFRSLWLQKKSLPHTAMFSSLVGLSFLALFFHLWSNEAVAISTLLVTGLFIADQ